MSDPFYDDHSSIWVPYADFLAGILVIFLVVAVLMLAHLNPTKKKTEDNQIVSPGSITVLASWKEDSDVDLWVKSPNDKPVGYSRKQGKHFDLLRDDLGRGFERAMNLHYENVFARTAPAGEYAINLHMYSNVSNAAWPIIVEIRIDIVKRVGDGKADIKKVLSTNVSLVKTGQEITVVRFKINQEGDLIDDSIRQDPIPLREDR